MVLTFLALIQHSNSALGLSSFFLNVSPSSSHPPYTLDLFLQDCQQLSEQLCQQLWTTDAGSEKLQWACRRHLNLNGKFLKNGMEKGTHSQKNSIPLVGKMLASLTPLRPSQVKARCSVWKSQVLEGLPLPYPVFICSHLTGVEGLWGSVVPEGKRPSALPKLWIQIRRHYNVRARQLLVGNPDANNNSAGEHLGPQFPGTHPILCLPQALPPPPPSLQGQLLLPVIVGRGGGLY